METMLSAGDMLYFPRGFVHQANALDEDYSHHVTLSTYQHNSWGNLMEKMVQGAMETAYEDIGFREGPATSACFGPLGGGGMVV